MKTLLILAYECVPYHRPGSTIGAQRPYQFAKHLPEVGWKVIVVCCDFNKRWTVTSEDAIHFIKDTMPQWLEELNQSNSVLIPLPSKKSAGYWDRLWLNCVEIDTALGTFLPKNGFAISAIRKISSIVKLFRGDYSQSWQDVAYKASMALVRETPIDFILAEHGPDAGVHVARKLHIQTRIKWCVDFRDPVLQFQNRYARPMVKLIYRHYLKSAEFIVNVNEYWAYLDQVDYQKPCFVVTNGYDQDEFQNTHPLNRPNHSKLILYYGGNIKIPYQNFNLLFEALYHLDGNDVNFVYVGNAHEFVRRQAKAFKIDQKVVCYPHLDRGKYLNMVRQADFLVLLSIQENKSRIFRNGFYPGKVFEYFAIRKPIICIPGDRAILDKLIQETKTGQSFDNSRYLSAYLSEMNMLKKEMKPIPYFPDSRVGFYTRKNQAKKLASYMYAALEGLIKGMNDFEFQ